MPSTATSIIDGLSTSVAVKAPCATVALTNITLAGLQTISGYTTVADDRVLVVGQTDPVENGIYSASTGQWQRTLDADGNRDLVQGTRVLVRSSTIDGAEFELTTSNPIVIDTNALTFVLRYGTNATYDQTAGEILAGVVPTNTLYQPGNIIRYGATGDGVTDDRTAIQKAINVARLDGTDVLLPPPFVYYLVQGDLDCTVTGGAQQRGFAIRGLGTPCIDKPTFVFDHAGEHCFDLAAARTVRLENFTVHTGDAYPGDCFFLARNAAGESILPKIYDVNVIGSFRDAVMYNYAGETGEYIRNYWTNRATDANAKTIILTANNSRSKTSSYVTIATGNKSCIGHNFEGGTLAFEGGIATGDVFELDEASNLKISKTFMFAFNATASSRALFFVNMANNPSNEHVHEAVEAEKSNSFIQQYYVLFSDHAKTPSGWHFLGCQMACGVAAIGTLGTNPVLSEFEMLRCMEPNNRGLVHPGGVVSDSTWDGQALTFTVGTTRRNKLRGDFSQITWTTNTDSTFDDTSVTPTFVPNTAALAVVGAETKSGRVKYRGPHAIVSIQLTAATSITAAGGEVIPVPKTPGFVGGSVKFINISTGVQVSGGYVSGAGIVCPAFATGAGETMLIHAEYEPA